VWLLIILFCNLEGRSIRVVRNFIQSPQANSLKGADSLSDGRRICPSRFDIPTDDSAPGSWARVIVEKASRNIKADTIRLSINISYLERCSEGTEPGAVIIQAENSTSAARFVKTINRGARRIFGWTHKKLRL